MLRPHTSCWFVWREGRRVYIHNKFNLRSFMLDYLWSLWFLAPKYWLRLITLNIVLAPFNSWNEFIYFFVLFRRKSSVTFKLVFNRFLINLTYCYYVLALMFIFAFLWLISDSKQILVSEFAKRCKKIICEKCISYLREPRLFLFFLTGSVNDIFSINPLYSLPLIFIVFSKV